jgi:hypothetical protein
MPLHLVRLLASPVSFGAKLGTVVDMLLLLYLCMMCHLCWRFIPIFVNVLFVFLIMFYVFIYIILFMFYLCMFYYNTRVQSAFVFCLYLIRGEHTQLPPSKQGPFVSSAECSLNVP